MKSKQYITTKHIRWIGYRSKHAFRIYLCRLNDNLSFRHFWVVFSFCLVGCVVYVRFNQSILSLNSCWAGYYQSSYIAIKWSIEFPLFHHSPPKIARCERKKQKWEIIQYEITNVWLLGKRIEFFHQHSSLSLTFAETIDERHDVGRSAANFLT